MAVTERPDVDLVREAGEGSEEAFTALYERYFDRLCDFAGRLCRDEDEAADVVQNTFVKAYTALRKSPTPPANVRSWLFAIAHHDAIDRMRRKRHLVPDADREDALTQLPDYVSIGPEEQSERTEAARQVWRAVQGLRPEEQSLLLLSVREGLDAGEIAEVLGKRRGTVHTMLSRARDSFEDSFTALILLSRSRRGECDELDEMRATAELSPQLRKHLRAHLNECAVCQRNRRRFVTASEILGAFVPIPASIGLSAAIWGQVDAGAATKAGVGARKEQMQSAIAAHPVWLIAILTGLVLSIAGAGVAVTAILAGGESTAVDGAVPNDPTDVRSTTHTVGEPSSEGLVLIEWSPAKDEGSADGEPSGIAGYSIEWTNEAGTIPDMTIDLAPDATSTSAQLAPGSWWFHLSTADVAGNWTRTVHYGPLIVTRVTATEQAQPEGAPSGTSPSGTLSGAAGAVAGDAGAAPSSPTGGESETGAEDDSSSALPPSGAPQAPPNGSAPAPSASTDSTSTSESSGGTTRTPGAGAVSTPRAGGGGASTPRSGGGGASTPRDGGSGPSTPGAGGGGTTTPVPGGGGTSTPAPGGTGTDPGATSTPTPGGPGVTQTTTPDASATATVTPDPNATRTTTPAPGATKTTTPGPGSTSTPAPGGEPSKTPTATPAKECHRGHHDDDHDHHRRHHEIHCSTYTYKEAQRAVIARRAFSLFVHDWRQVRAPSHFVA